MNLSFNCPPGYYWNNCWNYCVPCVSGWDPKYCSCIENKATSLSVGTGVSKIVTATAVSGEAQFISNTTGSEQNINFRPVIYRPDIDSATVTTINTGISIPITQSKTPGVPQFLKFLNGTSQANTGSDITSAYYFSGGRYINNIYFTIYNSSDNPSPNYIIATTGDTGIITGYTLQSITTAPDINNNTKTFYNLNLKLDTGVVVPPFFNGGNSGKFLYISATENGSDSYLSSSVLTKLSFYTQLYSIPTNTYLYSGASSNAYDVYNNKYYNSYITYPTVNIGSSPVQMATIYANCWGGIDSDKLAPFYITNSQYSGNDITYYFSSDLPSTIASYGVGVFNDLGLGTKFIKNTNSDSDGYKLNNGTNEYIYTKSGYFIAGNNSFEVTSRAYGVKNKWADTGYFPFYISGVVPIGGYASSVVTGVLAVLPNLSCPPISLYSGLYYASGPSSVDYNTPLITTTVSEVTSYGASILFDGESFIQIADSEDFNVEKLGQFTIEGWFYCTSLNDISSNIANTFISKDSFNGDVSLCLKLYSDAIYIASDSGNSQFTINTAISSNSWHHIALCSDSVNQYIYIDGNLVSTISLNLVNFYSPITIGCSTWNNPKDLFNGYISNVRIVKGVCVYNGNFSVPTLPLTNSRYSDYNISQVDTMQTILLLNMELGNPLLDGSIYTNKNIVAQGNLISSDLTPFITTNYTNSSIADMNVYGKLLNSKLNITIASTLKSPQQSLYKINLNYPAVNNLKSRAGLTSDYLSIPEVDDYGVLPYGTNYFSVNYKSNYLGSGQYTMQIQSDPYSDNSGPSTYLTVNISTPNYTEVPVSIPIEQTIPEIIIPDSAEFTSIIITP